MPERAEHQEQPGQAGPPWPLLGHGPLLEGLWRAARAEALPHALFFRGRAGSGRWRAARALAQGLLCAAGGPPCNACGPCKRFLSGNHPDVLVVDAAAEGEEILKLERFSAREDGRPDSSEAFLALRPVEGGWRIVLVREADRANKSAQNALLKSLEEPGDAVLWVLESARPERLLPTLRSRMVNVRFEPLRAEDVAALIATLSTDRGLAPQQAELLARWCGGSPGVALSLAARGAVDLRAILVGVLRGEHDGLAAARAVWAVEAEFPGRTPTAQARERARTVLDLSLALVRDLMRCVAGVDPRGLAHGDWIAAGPPIDFTNPALLAWQTEALLTARRDVGLNLDPQAALERALLALARRAPAARAMHVAGLS